jgi:hypothetical protein
VVYRGSGRGDLTTVVDTSAGAFRQLDGGAPRVTEAGRVLFSGTRTNNVFGIYDGPDPVANKIADRNGPYFPYEILRPRPDGTVLFGGVAPGRGFAVLAGSDAGASVVLEYGPAFDLMSHYVENRRGDFAFEAALKAGPGREPPGIFTGPNPATDTFALSSAPPNFWTVSDPRINDNAPGPVAKRITGAPCTTVYIIEILRRRPGGSLTPWTSRSALRAGGGP